MPVLDKNTLRQELKARDLRPAYLLFGPESYLRDGAARYISQQAFGEGDFRDLNETTFRLSTDADQLRQAIAAAEQLPMMAERRFVKVTEVRISATGYRDTVTEESESLLRSYLENPSPTTTIVFIADELNGNRKMTKLLKEKCAAVEFAALDDRALLAWTKKEFDKLGTLLSPLAGEYLVYRVGADLHRLSNEISKVAAATLPDRVVTEELIDQLVASTRELDNFAFANHLVAGRSGKAFAALKKILDDGSEPLALIGAISYTFRRLIMAKDMMERGLARAEVTKRLGGHPASHDAVFSAARPASLAGLSEAIRNIAAADVAIKNSLGGSGPSGARMQLEVLVAKLAVNLTG